MVGQLTRKWFEKPWSLGINDNDCGNRSIFMKMDGASASKFAVCFLLSCLPSSSASPAIRQTNFLLFKSPKLLASRRSSRLICPPFALPFSQSFSSQQFCCEIQTIRLSMLLGG